LYLALGWIILVSGFDLLRNIGRSGFIWVALGGVTYTLAAACEWYKWPVVIPGVFAWHETCHVLDMFGTGCHLVFMICCILPYRRPTIDTTGQVVTSRAA
jgi:hemolysin III